MNERQNPGLFAEILHYVKTNKRWLMIPIILALVLLGGLLVIAEVVPVVTPFVYTQF